MKTNAGNPFNAEAAALYWQRSEFGDNAAAQLAIVRYRQGNRVKKCVTSRWNAESVVVL
jgi:hypothetical protein